jgi:phosphoglycolate phosphatase
MRFDAVLFDLDGTLVDTSVLWSKATRDALDAFDLSLTEEEHFSLGGVLLHNLLAEKGYDQTTIKDVKAKRDELLLPVMQKEARWKEGAADLLRHLADLPTAIVTSAHRVMVDAMDEAIDIAAHIGVIIAGEDVAPRYKPDPYGLLLACERMQVDPTHCAYIGDQLCDMQAADAAGMQGILVRGRFTPEGLAHTTEASSLEELIGMF